MSQSNRLGRHLALCAAAVSCAAAQTAHADVVYSGIVNITVPANIDGTYLNVETGVYVNGPGSGNPGWDVNPYGSSLTAVSLFAAVGTGHMRNPAAGTSTARTRLDADTSIDPASFFYGSSSATIGTLVGQWSANASGIFGFKFLAADGLVHYGWLRMSIGANAATRVIVDYAFDNIAATGVRAGTGGGPPPAYNPCAPFNPAASVGNNNLSMNSTTAVNLVTSCGTSYKANYFKFTAPVDGPYGFTACATSGANVAVLDGCAPGSNVLSCGSPCLAGLSLTAGQIVYCVVGGDTEATVLPSPINVVVSAPPSPECAGATALAFGSNLFDNSASTMTQNIMAGAIASIFYKSTWYTFTPSVTGLYTLATCGSTNDTKLAIGTTCPVVGGTFTSFAYNDDACACGTGCGTALYSSRLDGVNTNQPLTQELVAGTTYRVLIGGYGTATLPTSGDLVIDGPPQSLPCPGDYNGDGLRNGSDLTTLLAAWGSAGGDINGDGNTNGSDLTILLAGWGTCPH